MLRVAGVALRGSGYPNAVNTLRYLREAGVQIDDCAVWLPEGFQLWRLARGPWVMRLHAVWQLFVLSAIKAISLCWLTRKQRSVTYVPYPSVFLLWWLSWLPRKWRPPLVADAFISIWDATVQDRGLLAEKSWGGRLLKRVETRALRVADRVLVDTEANRDWMLQAFGLRPEHVLSIPLAIDDTLLLSIAAQAPKTPLRVLFVGTFVPLHGVDVVVEAARLCSGRNDIHFHFIGDGQDAWKVEQLAASAPANFIWERGWLSYQEVAARLAGCDVCLGVFGGTGKAERVLPFKVYMALAAGRTVVTQPVFSLPMRVPKPSLLTVTPDADQLAASLLSLARNPLRVAALGAQGREFYVTWLGERAFVGAWFKLLRAVAAK